MTAYPLSKTSLRAGASLLLNTAFLLIIAAGCKSPATREDDRRAEDLFPGELVNFVADARNPVFTGTGENTWDQRIRERGFILKEADGYHLWYTGYSDNEGERIMSLGYATSSDGISWKRYPGNPVFSESWVEDMMVVRHDSLYYMFAEGKDDIAHMLTSSDKIHWEDHGSLDIRQTNGAALKPGPYGTPTVFIEGDLWHLFYERNDKGIWHATSDNLRQWTNVQDSAVITMGPEEYDRYGVAVNHVIRHGDLYYAYYHGTPTEDWSVWNTNVAVSKDLNNWTKFPGNPILEENKSSGILVPDGDAYRLYTMHEKVQLHVPAPAR